MAENKRDYYEVLGVNKRSLSRTHSLLVGHDALMGRLGTGPLFHLKRVCRSPGAAV